MATSNQMKRLATRPADMMRYQMTGKLPQGIVPKSPLITLLESISPRDRALIAGVTVDPRLGYNGSRIFATAEQALRWVKPSSEVFGTFPADSWRDPRFQGPLTVADLVSCCSQVPEHLTSKPGRRLRP